jgi:hypothetical protein
MNAYVRVVHVPVPFKTSYLLLASATENSQMVTNFYCSYSSSFRVNAACNQTEKGERGGTYIRQPEAEKNGGADQKARAHTALLALHWLLFQLWGIYHLA